MTGAQPSTTRLRITIASMAAAFTAVGLITSTATQDQMGSNAETWWENFAKWHQAPLLLAAVISAGIAVALPITSQRARAAVRVSGLIVAVCGVVKSPWLLAGVTYLAYLNWHIALVAVMPLLLWATAILIWRRAQVART